MRGLEWLARVGPSPLDPWRHAMGWSEVAARHHARRLEAEGWLERCAMVRGDGSLFWATRKGVRVLGLPLIAATPPAATWWAHDSACAWTSAWATVRGRQYLGPRELLSNPEWSGELYWVDRHSSKRRGHRPDLVAFLSDQAIPIEVELANKSKTRLDAILKLHLRWIIARKSAALIYICGDEEGCRRIERAGRRVGLYATSRSLRIELLGTIKAQTLAEVERPRAKREAAAAPRGSVLSSVHASLPLRTT
ncbi:MAG TPA: hypothetical protein VGG07_17030 [Solirubrobacteraceae bacterium]